MVWTIPKLKTLLPVPSYFSSDVGRHVKMERRKEGRGKGEKKKRKGKYYFLLEEKYRFYFWGLKTNGQSFEFNNLDEKDKFLEKL